MLDLEPAHLVAEPAFVQTNLDHLRSSNHNSKGEGRPNHASDMNFDMDVNLLRATRISQQEQKKTNVESLKRNSLRSFDKHTADV